MKNCSKQKKKIKEKTKKLNNLFKHQKRINALKNFETSTKIREKVEKISKNLKTNQKNSSNNNQLINKI